MSRSCDVLFVPVNPSVLNPKNAHNPVNPRRAESPMASIAQGKRSDTLGKPPHPITPRPVRAKVNVTRSVSALLSLQGATIRQHFYPGRRFACRWAMNFCPFGACPLNAPHRKTDTSTLQGVPVLTSTHTTLRLRKICAICRAYGAICGSPITPNGICKSAICGKQNTPCFSHSTQHNMAQSVTLLHVTCY